MFDLKCETCIYLVSKLKSFNSDVLTSYCMNTRSPRYGQIIENSFHSFCLNHVSHEQRLQEEWRQTGYQDGYKQGLEDAVELTNEELRMIVHVDKSNFKKLFRKIMHDLIDRYEPDFVGLSEPHPPGWTPAYEHRSDKYILGRYQGIFDYIIKKSKG